MVWGVTYIALSPQYLFLHLDSNLKVPWQECHGLIVRYRTG
ncbi:MAG: hypothetical protein OJF58_000004 [Enhydrobacter sp.]|nr:MAG: hypothetical protein OJF58_000004 [Enhydrobacter sp.]